MFFVRTLPYCRTSIGDCKSKSRWIQKLMPTKRLDPKRRVDTRNNPSEMFKTGLLYYTKSNHINGNKFTIKESNESVGSSSTFTTFPNQQQKPKTEYQFSTPLEIKMSQLRPLLAFVHRSHSTLVSYDLYSPIWCKPLSESLQ